MRIRRASGGREGELVRRASKLRESVDPLLPRLARNCPPDRFDRLRRDLEEVRVAKDDEHRLDRMRRWGEPLVRAYAGLLRFYLEPELPALIVARYPSGKIPYAPLSKASREAEVAVQYSDDPTRAAPRLPRLGPQGLPLLCDQRCPLLHRFRPRAAGGVPHQTAREPPVSTPGRRGARPRLPAPGCGRPRSVPWRSTGREPPRGSACAGGVRRETVTCSATWARMPRSRIRRPPSRSRSR